MRKSFVVLGLSLFLLMLVPAGTTVRAQDLSYFPITPAGGAPAPAEYYHTRAQVKYSSFGKKFFKGTITYNYSYFYDNRDQSDHRSYDYSLHESITYQVDDKDTVNETISNDYSVTSYDQSTKTTVTDTKTKYETKTYEAGAGHQFLVNVSATQGQGTIEVGTVGNQENNKFKDSSSQVKSTVNAQVEGTLSNTSVGAVHNDTFTPGSSQVNVDVNANVNGTMGVETTGARNTTTEIGATQGDNSSVSVITNN